MATLWRQLDDAVLVAPKLLYITMAFSFYAFYIVRATFATQYLGLDVSQFGDLWALMAAVGFLSMAPWGKLADVTGRHKLVVGFCSAGLAGSFLLFLFRWDSRAVTFAMSALILALYSFFSSGLMPLTDYHALKMLQERPDVTRDHYGRQRVWGTIAFGAITYAVGALVDAYGPTVLFVVVPSTALLFMVTVYLMAIPDSPVPLGQVFRKAPATPSEPSASQSTSKDDLLSIDADVVKLKSEPGSMHTTGTRSPIAQLMTNPSFMFLLVFVFLSGSARAVMSTFAAMYWRKDLAMTNRQTSMAANYGILLEIIIFFLSPLLLRVFGIYWMLILSQVAMAARCWLYAFLPAGPDMAWYVYGIELLKGAAFGFGQVAGVKICVDVAPVGLEATAQAVFTSVYSQLPAVLASAIGGRLYQWYGAQMLFLVTAVISTVALVLFSIKYTYDGRLFGRFRRPSALV